MSERKIWEAGPEESPPQTERKTMAGTTRSLSLAPSFLSWANFMNGARRAANVVLTFACFAALAIISWHSALFFQAPDFSEVKAHFEAKGHAVDGEWISELGKVCRNGAGTPMACEMLYFNHSKESAMVGKESAMVASVRGNEGESEHHE